MIYIELVALVGAVIHFGIAAYYDWNDNDIKGIKHTLLAFILVMAASEAAG